MASLKELLAKQVPVNQAEIKSLVKEHGDIKVVLEELGKDIEDLDAGDKPGSH